MRSEEQGVGSKEQGMGNKEAVNKLKINNKIINNENWF